MSWKQILNKIPSEEKNYFSQTKTNLKLRLKNFTKVFENFINTTEIVGIPVKNWFIVMILIVCALLNVVNIIRYHFDMNIITDFDPLNYPFYSLISESILGAFFIYILQFLIEIIKLDFPAILWNFIEASMELILNFISQIFSLNVYFKILELISEEIIPTIWLLASTCFTPILFLFILIISFIKNPIYALIFLINVFLLTAFLLFSMKAKFLALLYVIIYLGSIAILFLFILMMFNLKELHVTKPNHSFYRQILLFNMATFLCLSSKCYFIIVNSIYNILQYNPLFNTLRLFCNNQMQQFVLFQANDILLFGQFLYTYYALFFLFATIILLVSMIGAIVLALLATNQILKIYT